MQEEQNSLNNSISNNSIENNTYILEEDCRQYIEPHLFKYRVIFLTAGIIISFVCFFICIGNAKQKKKMWNTIIDILYMGLSLALFFLSCLTLKPENFNMILILGLLDVICLFFLSFYFFNKVFDFFNRKKERRLSLVEDNMEVIVLKEVE